MLEYLIKIDSGQYLSDILSLIPNNVILNKTLTGCGATTLEINAAEELDYHRAERTRNHREETAAPFPDASLRGDDKR